MSRRQRAELFREFEQWGWNTRGWVPSTGYKYRTRIQQADRWLTEHRNTSIAWAKPDDLKAFLFQAGKSAVNRNGTRQALVAFGCFLMDSGYADVNHALTLPRLPQPKALPKALTSDQAYRAEVAARLDGLRTWALVGVMLYAGLRLQEAQKLEWRHVDLDDGWVNVVMGKGQRDRVVPAGQRLVKILSQWRHECDSAQWVFPSTRIIGKPMSTSGIQNVIYALGDECGIERLHPHAFRHTYATGLVESGAHLSVVQALLGHACTATTSIYIKVRPVGLREAVDRLAFKPSADEEQDDAE